MVNITDKVVLDISDNEELAEYITSKAPGDECSMEIIASLDESTDEQAVFSIRDVTVEQDDYSEEELDEGDEVNEEDMASPVMAVMVGKEDY
tara:strand:- start:281 stop:556 length:276 start_codon:yes stop_codon:yes gene_type:complete